MNANHTSIRFSPLKAMGFFMGASFFAYLLSVGVHELGHYLAAIILGVPEKGIVLNPFGTNYNIYLGDLSVALGTPLRGAFSGLSGPIFDLLITVTIGLLLWRKRSPALLPLLLPGSYALIHESVNVVFGVLTGPYTDWGQVVSFGIPAGVVILLAVLMLAAGCIWMLQLLPLTGISYRDLFWKRLVVFFSGMPLLFLCAVVYQTLFGMNVHVPSWGGVLTMESLREGKIIFMLAASALTVIVTPLHRPLSPWLDRFSHTPVAQVHRRDVLVAIGLGLAITVIQLVFFNDPTAVVVTAMRQIL